MKIIPTITMAAVLLLAAGCAHEESSYSSNEAGYSSGRMSEYNSQNTYSTPSVGGSYSADGSYSSGGGGTYSHQPAYSGNVGADGSYTPNDTSGSSSGDIATGGFAGSAGVESDNAIVAQVRESLRRDPEIALIVPNLQITANNGAIILNGHVQSEEQKRQIFSKVQGITGVVAVNNQLNVIAGSNGQNSNEQNATAQNPNGSQLSPTGNSTGSQPIYKDANGQDTSTNNALNSNQDNALDATSRTNSSSRIYHNSNGQDQNSQPQNSNLSTNSLNPTSRSGGQSQIYQNGQEQNQSNMNRSSNSVNSSDNTIAPTSRQNGTNRIYQNNPGETLQNQNTDTNNIQNNMQNQ